MTISTTTNSVQYTGNGVTTAFAVPFVFYAASDLIVTYTVIATGVDTVKTITTDYTVSGGSGSTGTVTALSAPASTIRVTIERSIPYTQETDFIEGAAVLAETVEQGFDRAVVMAQQNAAEVSRALVFPTTLGGSYTGRLPAPEDGKLLVWDGATGQIANATLASLSTSLDTLFTGLASGDFLSYNGTNWVNSNAADTRTVLGLGSLATENIAPLAKGGTGANYASNAALFSGIKQAATDSATGVVELATDTEVKTGTSTSLAVTPANVKNQLGFSAYFESAVQTITSSGGLTIAHGLGRKPILVVSLIKCTSAEHNYSVGDEVFVPWSLDGADVNGCNSNCIPDATNLNVIFGSASATFSGLNKTTGAQVSFTNANWNYILRAWA